MRFNLFLFAALWFSLGLPMNSAQAQSAAAAAPGATATSAAAFNPADPQARVPVLIYHSVFQAADKGVVSEATDWREANDQVGQFKRGHIDVLKWEEQAVPAKDGAAQRAPGSHGPAVKKP